MDEAQAVAGQTVRTLQQALTERLGGSSSSTVWHEDVKQVGCSGMGEEKLGGRYDGSVVSMNYLLKWPYSSFYHVSAVVLVPFLFAVGITIE
jgi:hypothetical protein